MTPPSTGAGTPVMSPLDVSREAFVSRLHHVLDLAGKRDDRFTKKQVEGLVRSLEAHLDEYLKHLFAPREETTR